MSHFSYRAEVRKAAQGKRGGGVNPTWQKAVSTGNGEEVAHKGPGCSVQEREQERRLGTARREQPRRKARRDLGDKEPLITEGRMKGLNTS